MAEHQNHYSQLEAKHETASKRAKVAQANLEEVEANMTEARAKVFMAVTEVDLANTSRLEFFQLHRRGAISADEAKETVREEARTERAKVYQEFESAPEVEEHTMRIRDLQEFIRDPATTQVEIDTSQVMIDTYTVKLKDAINAAHQGTWRPC